MTPSTQTYSVSSLFLFLCVCACAACKNFLVFCLPPPPVYIVNLPLNEVGIQSPASLSVLKSLFLFIYFFKSDKRWFFWKKKNSRILTCADGYSGVSARNSGPATTTMVTLATFAVDPRLKYTTHLLRCVKVNIHLETEQQPAIIIRAFVCTRCYF